MTGSTFRIGGDVVVVGAEDGVGIGGVTIAGDVLVHHSGAENGIGVNANVIGGSVAIVHNTIVGAVRRSDIDVFGNTVGDDLIVSHNDATAAFEPTFVGSNVVLRGDLICRHNIPDVVNDPPAGRSRTPSSRARRSASALICEAATGRVRPSGRHGAFQLRPFRA